MVAAIEGDEPKSVAELEPEPEPEPEQEQEPEQKQEPELEPEPEADLQDTPALDMNSLVVPPMTVPIQAGTVGVAGSEVGAHVQPIVEAPVQEAGAVGAVGSGVGTPMQAHQSRARSSSRSP